MLSSLPALVLSTFALLLGGVTTRGKFKVSFWTQRKLSDNRMHGDNEGPLRRGHTKRKKWRMCLLGISQLVNRKVPRFVSLFLLLVNYNAPHCPYHYPWYCPICCFGSATADIDSMGLQIYCWAKMNNFL